MSLDPTLTINISRLLLPGDLDPLEFSATLDGTTLGILSYQEPAMLQRLGYMQDHPDVDGSELTSASLQKVLLGFDWFADLAETEAEAQSAKVEVRAALRQIAYTVTTQVSGAPAEVWFADPGNMTPSPRTYDDLVNLGQAHEVSIPVQPIPGAP